MPKEMLKIETKTGSATSPTPGDNPIVIGHIVNTAGGFGKGFVLAVNQLSRAPEMAYRAWAKEGQLVLGNTQFVEAKPDIFIANMVAQDGYPSDHADGVAVNYEALEKCLGKVLCRAVQLGADVNFPSGMGSGLAGGDKDTIIGIVEKVGKTIGNDANLNITLWDFKDTTSASYVPTRKSPTPEGSGEAIDDLTKLG